MRQLLNTLYVTSEPSYLHLDHETIRLKVEGKTRVQLPLLNIGAITCFGNVLVSPGLIAKCAMDGRAIVFLDRRGQFRARVEGPRSGNILLRKAQFEQAMNVQKVSSIACDLVAGKIQNSRQMLVRTARETKETADRGALHSAARDLKRSLHSLVRAREDTAPAEQVRGIEGDAARVYFGVFDRMIRQQRENFPMHERNRRPPLDRLNALLSFLYTLLVNDCVSAAEGVGLDPQMGFLHTPRPGRPSLALDLMEELRVPCADRLAIALINLRQINAEDFEARPGGAVLLTADGRKKVITAYQKRKQETIRHPLLDRSLEVGLIPHVQARLLARMIRGDSSQYIPFLLR